MSAPYKPLEKELQVVSDNLFCYRGWNIERESPPDPCKGLYYQYKIKLESHVVYFDFLKHAQMHIDRVMGANLNAS